MESCAKLKLKPIKECQFSVRKSESRKLLKFQKFDCLAKVIKQCDQTYEVQNRLKPELKQQNLNKLPDDNSQNDVSQIKKRLIKDYNLFIEGHSKPITSIIITSDNRFIVSGSKDCTIRVWANYQQKFVFQGHTSEVNSLAITSDDKFIVSGSSDNTVLVWNLQEMGLEAVFLGHTSEVRSVAITGEDKFVVSGSADGTLIIWNIYKREKEFTLYGHESCINSVAANSRFIVTGSSDTTVRVWSFAFKHQVALFKANTNAVNCVAISKNSSLVVSGSTDGTILVWNLKNKRIESGFKNNHYNIQCLAIYNDNKFVTVGSTYFKCAEKTKMYLLNIEKQCEESKTFSEKIITSLALSKDNKTVYSSFSSGLVSIHREFIEQIENVELLSFITPFACCAAISIDCKLVVSGYENCIVRVWNVEEKVEKITFNTSQVSSVAITNNNIYVVAAHGDTAIVWKLKSK